MTTRTGPQPMVWALIPYGMESGKLTADTYESERTKAELAEAFCRLGISWIWQPVVLASLPEVTSQLIASASQRCTVAFNFCDGLDHDGIPGLSVVRALEIAGVPFTGSDSRFYEISTYKVRMKELFRARGIETAPWEVLPRAGRIIGVCERLDAPLIVKPDVSFASCGISLRSKVGTDAEIEARRDELREGGMPGSGDHGEIFAERYLAGDEYTVFVGGYSDHPESLWTLAPARRCFAESIPEHERFLTYDRYWGYYREEEAPSAGEPFYRYELVGAGLSEELAELAKQAYCAVHGQSYARVDIRRDTVNGKLSVLEVNANCGISGDDQTSTGSILELMGYGVADLLERIIAQALEYRPLRAQAHVARELVPAPPG